RDYYPMQQVPEFWDWLVDRGTAGRLKIPEEIYDDILEGNEDGLPKWLKEKPVRAALLFNESPDLELVDTVLAKYGLDLTDSEIEEIGSDAFLIAYALRNPPGRGVITAEKSSPSKQRQNR